MTNDGRGPIPGGQPDDETEALAVRRQLSQTYSRSSEPNVDATRELQFDADHHSERRRPRSTGWAVVGRFVLAFIAVIALGGSAVGWTIFQRAQSVVQEREIDALAPDDPGLRTPNQGTTPSGEQTGADGTGDKPGSDLPEPPKAGGRGENVLLIGADTRTGAERESMSTSQSDVLMLAHVGVDNAVSVMSIPRDTAVKAPTCKRWNDVTGEVYADDFPPSGSVWKITNAYAVGGPRCTVQAVQALTGIRVDRVVMIDFVGFKAMIDALGGVTLTFPNAVVDNGRQVAPAGTSRFTGDQALAVVRARKVAGDGSGDIGRTKRQQQVLAALLNQVASSRLVLDPGKLDSVLQAFVSNTRTANMSFGELLDFATMIGRPEAKRPLFFTLPTVPGSDERLALGADADAIFQAIVNDAELPPSVAASTTPGS